jgi:hypothetical protein
VSYYRDWLTGKTGVLYCCRITISNVESIYSKHHGAIFPSAIITHQSPVASATMSQACSLFSSVVHRVSSCASFQMPLRAMQVVLSSGRRRCARGGHDAKARNRSAFWVLERVPPSVDTGAKGVACDLVVVCVSVLDRCDGLSISGPSCDIVSNLPTEIVDQNLQVGHPVSVIQMGFPPATPTTASQSPQNVALAFSMLFGLVFS